MDDVVKTEAAIPPEQSAAPQIDIPDSDVDEAAEQLGYAVIKGKDIKRLKTIGQAAGLSGHIHIGRAWLMMAQTTAQKMVEQLDSIIDSPNDADEVTDMLRLKQKTVLSMVSAAKTMIESSNGESQSSGSAPTRRTGFGPGMAAMPVFPIQINIPSADNTEKKVSHVKRDILES